MSLNSYHIPFAAFVTAGESALTLRSWTPPIPRLKTEIEVMDQDGRFVDLSMAIDAVSQTSTICRLGYLLSLGRLPDHCEYEYTHHSHIIVSACEEPTSQRDDVY